MSIAAWIDTVSILENGQIWKNNVSQWDDSNLYNININRLEQTINNYGVLWEDFVSKKEFADILKIIKYIMDQDTNTIVKMQSKINELDEEIRKLKEFSK